MNRHLEDHSTYELHLMRIPHIIRKRQEWSSGSLRRCGDHPDRMIDDTKVTYAKMSTMSYHTYWLPNSQLDYLLNT